MSAKSAAVISVGRRKPRRFEPLTRQAYTRRGRRWPRGGIFYIPYDFLAPAAPGAGG
jgi:hypothetical protein